MIIGIILYPAALNISADAFEAFAAVRTRLLRPLLQSSASRCRALSRIRALPCSRR